MTVFKVDCAHSEVTFKVKHLMITNITGYFHSFDATLRNPNDDNTFVGSKVTFSTQVQSVTTNNKQRDEHIKGVDFFDAEKYPNINFESTKIIQNEKQGTYEMQGNLEIKGISKPITLDVAYTGKVVDMYENTKFGFEIRGKINRKDFGLTWNAITEAGGVTVSEIVDLHMHIQCEKVQEEVYA